MAELLLAAFVEYPTASPDQLIQLFFGKHLSLHSRQLSDAFLCSCQRASQMCKPTNAVQLCYPIAVVNHSLIFFADGTVPIATILPLITSAGVLTNP